MPARKPRYYPEGRELINRVLAAGLSWLLPSLGRHVPAASDHTMAIDKEIHRMTKSYLPQSMPPPEWDTSQPPLAANEDQDTAGVVKDQAADLGHEAAQAGKHVADTAREQAANVTAVAGRQGKDMLRQAQGQLIEQASQQQRRLADELRAMSDELSAMASRSDRPGVAADLAQQAAGPARNVAQWLDDREPGQLLQEVKTFARQRPGVFLALAASAGLLAGRLTRSLAAETQDQPAPGAAQGAVAAGVSPGVTGTGAEQEIATGSAGYPSSADLPAATDAWGVPVSATELPPPPPVSSGEGPGAAGAGYEQSAADPASTEGPR